MSLFPSDHTEQKKKTKVKVFAVPPTPPTTSYQIMGNFIYTRVPRLSNRIHLCCLFLLHRRYLLQGTEQGVVNPLDTAGPDGGQCHVDSAAAHKSTRSTCHHHHQTLSSCLGDEGRKSWVRNKKRRKKRRKNGKTSHSHYYVSLGETRLALATFAFIAFNPFFSCFLLLCSMFSWLLLACSARKGQANRNGYFGATFNVMAVLWQVHGWIFMRGEEGEIMFTLIVQFLV